MAINTIKATTAITRKIPKPIPALKIPAIASQELKVKEEIHSKVNTAREFIFFMQNIFKVV